MTVPVSQQIVPQQITVRVVRETDNALPAYETAHSAGLDLRAHLAEALLLAPGERVLVPTGLRVEIPPGFEGQEKHYARSGRRREGGTSIAFHRRHRARLIG